MHQLREDNADLRNIEEKPAFTLRKLGAVVSSLRNKKIYPEPPLKIYNACLTPGIFSTRWKKSLPVLIIKSKNEEVSLSSLRPLCMLDTPGQLLKNIFKSGL